MPVATSSQTATQVEAGSSGTLKLRGAALAQPDTVAFADLERNGVSASSCKSQNDLVKNLRNVDDVPVSSDCSRSAENKTDPSMS